MDFDNKLYTEEQFAELTGFSRQQLYKWRQEKKLPFIRLGEKSIRYTNENLKQFIKNIKSN